MAKLGAAGRRPRGVRVIRVKICCIATPEEARIAAAAGAHLLGLVGPMPSGAGIITPEQCRAVALAAPAWASPVLLTASDTAGAIAADVDRAGVRAVQIVRPVPAQVHRALARARPGVRRIQAIHVEDTGALDLIGVYEGLVDAFLLDSGRPSAAELGGTGRTHDWSISAAFVRRAPVPVFLAGGLNAANAAEAIRQVRPFGLDICSGVRDAGDRLDPGRLAAFMGAVRAAERDLTERDLT